MKIYARQIAPEYQESPLFYSEWPENVHVYGNKVFKEHGHYYKTVENINYFAEDLEELRAGNAAPGYDNVSKLLQTHFPRENPYTRSERLRFIDIIIKHFFEAREYSSEERAAVVEIMGMWDGIEYECATLRGCCQSDWVYCIYPAEYGREWLRAFEAEYFNTGTEWIVHDEENAPESPEDISGYSVYCTAWNDEGIKKEIAEAADGSPEEVTLYKFEGWTKHAKYKEVI
jgi:hypothetical protein